jgi:DNA-binding MarR family transcriptional regulator
MEDRSGAELPAALRKRTVFVIVRLAADLRKRLGDEFAHVGVSQHQHAILCCLDEFGPAFQKDVAARLGIDTGDTVALVEGLERDGLITRQRDPRDRRRQILEITELGTGALTQIELALDQVEHDELITLSDHDRTALHDSAVRALTHRSPGAWPVEQPRAAPEPPIGGAPPRRVEPDQAAAGGVAPASAPTPIPDPFHELLRLLAVVPRAALDAGRTLLAPVTNRWHS